MGIITESDIFRVFSKLLSGQPGSTRITFDITDKANALGSWVRLCEELKLELTSLITFTDGARRLAVARVKEPTPRASSTASGTPANPCST